MWVVPALFSLFFIVLGLVFIQGKGAFLIAGYNTSSRAECQIMILTEELILCLGLCR